MKLPKFIHHIAALAAAAATTVQLSAETQPAGTFVAKGKPYPVLLNVPVTDIERARDEWLHLTQGDRATTALLLTEPGGGNPRFILVEGLKCSDARGDLFLDKTAVRANQCRPKGMQFPEPRPDPKARRA